MASFKVLAVVTALKLSPRWRVDFRLRISVGVAVRYLLYRMWDRAFLADPLPIVIRCRMIYLDTLWGPLSCLGMMASI